MHASSSVRRWLAAVAAVLLLSAVWVGTAAAQIGGAIRGTVTEAGTRRPLENARVILVGQNREIRTDANGNYQLRNVDPGTYTVQALFIGYNRMEGQVTVSTGQVAIVDFLMDRAPIELDALVVTGTAGRTERREIGNSVTSLSVEELVPLAPIANVEELLNARSPGLTMYKSSGLAGSGSNVRIRGAGSLNASYMPVYYIDGIRFEGTATNILGNSNATLQYRSPLDFIDPADIERIEVVKGPAAATLYGADAASGVIQIITKKGTRGVDRVQWSASFELGQSEWVRETPTTYYQCTAARIRSTSYPGCNNPAGLQYVGPNGDTITGIPESDIIRNPEWGDSLFVLTDNPLKRHGRALRAGNSYDFKLSARGGGQLFNYYMSFGQYDEEGIFLNNFSKRTGGRANFEFTPIGNLSLGLNVGYTRNHLRMPLSDNASDGLLRNAYRARARGTRDPWEPGFRGFGPDQTNEYNAQVREERTTIGFTANFDPWPWFENRLVLGLDKYDVRETSFYQIDSTLKWGATNGTGAITQRLPMTHTWTIDYSGSVRARLSSVLTSRFSAGMQLNARQYRRYTASADGLVANSVNLIGTAANTEADEGFSEQTSLGFYVQEQIGWRDKVFFTGALRVDDNSAFGSQFSMVVYPKVSASWVISEESFFRLPGVHDLKLRFAWGQAGNAPAPFEADRTVQADIVTVDAVSTNALRPSEFGNPDLKAETGDEWEVGFDASLFNGMLGLEATYYNQHTKDALMEIPDPPSSGFSGTHFVNIGEIANSGFELLATATPVRSRAFTWDLTASFSTTKNELVSFGLLPDGTPARDEVTFGGFTTSQRHREGFPLGGFWSVDVLRDANGDPIVTNNNVTVDTECTWPDTEDPSGRGGSCHEQYVGPSSPTRELGLANTFTFFNNLRLFVQLDYKGGYYQLCAICSINSRSDQNTWDVNNPDIDPVERMRLLATQTVDWIQQADFLKLREISLTYQIPRSWGGPFRASRWSLKVAARNLWTTTKYKGPGDPEVRWAPRDGRFTNFEVLDYASVPTPRRISASITVNF